MVTNFITRHVFSETQINAEKHRFSVTIQAFTTRHIDR